MAIGPGFHLWSLEQVIQLLLSSKHSQIRNGMFSYSLPPASTSACVSSLSAESGSISTIKTIFVCFLEWLAALDLAGDVALAQGRVRTWEQQLWD